MFGNIGMLEIAILAVVLLVLFGSSYLPKVARNTGESAKEMKRATYDFKDAVTGKTE